MWRSRSPVGSSATISVGSVTSARAGDALLLAAGQLVGIVVGAVVGQPPPGPWAASTRSRVHGPTAGQQQRQLDVLEGGQHRHQVVELEDEADVGCAPVGQLAFAFRSARRCGRRSRDGAAAGLVDAAIGFSSVLLPEPLGPHQRDEVAGRHVEVDVRAPGSPARRAGRPLPGCGCGSAARRRRPPPWPARHLPPPRPSCWRGTARPEPFRARTSERAGQFLSRSPILRPGVTGTASSVSPCHGRHLIGCRRRSPMALGLTAITGFWSASRGPGQDGDLGAHLGGMRASSFSKRIFGSSPWPWHGRRWARRCGPRRRGRHVGSGVEGDPVRLVGLDAADVALRHRPRPSSVDMSAIITTAPEVPLALRERRDHVAHVGVLHQHRHRRAPDLGSGTTCYWWQARLWATAAWAGGHRGLLRGQCRRHPNHGQIDPPHPPLATRRSPGRPGLSWRLSSFCVVEFGAGLTQLGLGANRLGHTTAWPAAMPYCIGASSHAISSPAFTTLPSAPAGRSRRPVPFDDTAARLRTTYPGGELGQRLRRVATATGVICTSALQGRQRRRARRQPGRPPPGATSSGGATGVPGCGRSSATTAWEQTRRQRGLADPAPGGGARGQSAIRPGRDRTLTRCGGHRDRKHAMPRHADMRLGQPPPRCRRSG